MPPLDNAKIYDCHLLANHRPIMATVTIGKNSVGERNSAYIVGEVGINHNGNLELHGRMEARRLSELNCRAASGGIPATEDAESSQ